MRGLLSDLRMAAKYFELLQLSRKVEPYLSPIQRIYRVNSLMAEARYAEIVALDAAE